MAASETGSDSSKMSFVDYADRPPRSRRTTRAFKVLIANNGLPSVCYVTATRSGKITCYKRELLPGGKAGGGFLPGHGRRAKRKGRTGPCLEAAAAEAKKLKELDEARQHKLPFPE